MRLGVSTRRKRRPPLGDAVEQQPTHLENSVTLHEAVCLYMLEFGWLFHRHENSEIHFSRIKTRPYMERVKCSCCHMIGSRVVLSNQKKFDKKRFNVNMLLYAQVWLGHPLPTRRIRHILPPLEAPTAACTRRRPGYGDQRWRTRRPPSLRLAPRRARKESFP